MNKVYLIGTLIDEPRLNKSISGKNYLSGTLAIKKGKDDKGNDISIYVNMIFWNNTAEYLSNYAKKGGRIAVEGELNQRKTYNEERMRNDYELEIIPRNVEIIDFKERQRNEKLIQQEQTHVEKGKKEDPFDMFSRENESFDFSNDDDFPF